MTWANVATPPSGPVVTGGAGTGAWFEDGVNWTTHNGRAHLVAPEYYRPVWHVGHLVYQGGVPNLKRSSLTGPGFIPQNAAHAYMGGGLATRGHQQPSWQPYATPVSSQTGSGFAPSRPNFLTRLFGGAIGASQ
jgi:hypothetical protein